MSTATAYKLGYEASAKNQQTNINPYEKGTPERAAWAAGFAYEQATRTSKLGEDSDNYL